MGDVCACVHACMFACLNCNAFLFVIQGFVLGCFLPLAYVLLSRKTQTSYEVMFRIFEEHGCDPSTVLIDFEKSVENALHSVFGHMYK